MKLNFLIKILGIFDLAYFLALVVPSVYHGHIPILHELQEQISAGRAFGHSIAVWGPIAGSIVLLTTPISGWFLLKRRKVGGYLSFVQLPFRLMLVIPPTFFYLSKFAATIPESYIFFIMLIFLFEILKSIFIGRWLYLNRTL